MKYSTLVSDIKHHDLMLPNKEDLARVEKVRSYIEIIDDDIDSLSDKQYKFIEDMKAKLAVYGDNAIFTDGQYGWIKGMWEKIMENEDMGF